MIVSVQFSVQFLLNMENNFLQLHECGTKTTGSVLFAVLDKLLLDLFKHTLTFS